MRIAVINLQFGVGTTRGYWQYPLTIWKYLLPHSVREIERAARECKSGSVDIAIVTELSTSKLRSSHSQVDVFKDAFGEKYVHFFASATSRLWNEGNAIGTRYEIVATRTHRLKGGIVPRILGEASLKVGDEIVTVLIAHLSLGKRARERQVEEILSIVAKKKGPVILGGDFNDRDSSRLGRMLGNTFAHSCALPTFPSWNPKYALQRLFVNETLVLENERVSHSSPYSDHATLHVEARLK